MNYYGLPDKYNGIGLLEEIKIVRYVAKRAKERKQPVIFFACINTLALLIQAELSTNSAPSMQKEGFVFILVDIIRARVGEKFADRFLERIHERWNELECRIITMD